MTLSAPSDLSGTSFLDAEVADLYVHRPPYASEALQCILANVATPKRLLDLGGGEGKIARPFAKIFENVVAVDPSVNMMALGRSLENGDAKNIQWICAKAEEAPIEGVFDLVTFASSIHWMDPGRLFPRLRRHLARDHRIAIVAGDEPFDPPWGAEFKEFLEYWVPEITGRPLGSKDWQSARDRHLAHVTVFQAAAFVSDPIEQSVESFILCQHARDTFAYAKLAARLPAFQRHLREVLEPHQNAQGLLSYRVKTQVTLAQLRSNT